MDLPLESSFTDLDGQASHIFRNFMTRVAVIEEHRSIGYQLLVDFKKELGFFGRPPLMKESPMIQNVINDNQTREFKKYIEAGYRHAYMGALNICKLNLCQEGLQGHLSKVKTLLDEVGSLSEDGLRMMQAVNRHSLRMLDRCVAADRTIQEGQSETGDDQHGITLPHVEGLLLPSILMRVLHNMLKRDYKMQERIILSLGLSSSSEELESYCLMWELGPFLDDDIMKDCWKLIPESRTGALK